MPRPIRYTTPWNATVKDLEECFGRWHIRRDLWRIEAAATQRKAYNQALGPTQRAVSLHFPFGGRELVLSCDAQDTPAGNLRVLYLAVDAMRLNEVRGLSDVMREAYLQLEAPAKVRDPYEVLGARPDAPIEVIEASYKALAKMHHPDVGGDAEAFKEVAAAWDRVQVDRGVKA